MFANLLGSSSLKIELISCFGLVCFFSSKNENIEQIKVAITKLESLKPDSILIGRAKIKLKELNVENAINNKNIDQLKDAITNLESLDPNHNMSWF